MIHDNLGTIGTDPFYLDTRVFVTAVSANSGSNLGGTLLEIDGANFSEDPTEHPVLVDGYECTIISITSEKIICRIVELATIDPVPTSTGLIIVNAVTTEEASISGSPGCGESPAVDMSWTWADPLCSTTGLSVAFDATLNANVATFTGFTGLDYVAGDLTYGTLLVDGIE